MDGIPEYVIFDRSPSSAISRELERHLTALKAHHIRYGTTSYDRSHPMLRPRTEIDISIVPRDIAFHFRNLRSETEIEARVDVFTHRMSDTAIALGIPIDFIDEPYISPDDLALWEADFSPDIETIADWYRWGFTPGRAALWVAVDTKIPVNAAMYETEGRPAIMGPFISAVGTGHGSNMETYNAIVGSFAEPPSEYDTYELMVRMNGWSAAKVVCALVPGMSEDYLKDSGINHHSELSYLLTAFRSGYPSEWVAKVIEERREQAKGRQV